MKKIKFIVPPSKPGTSGYGLTTSRRNAVVVASILVFLTLAVISASASIGAGGIFNETWQTLNRAHRPAPGDFRLLSNAIRNESLQPYFSPPDLAHGFSYIAEATVRTLETQRNQLTSAVQQAVRASQATVGFYTALLGVPIHSQTQLFAHRRDQFELALRNAGGVFAQLYSAVMQDSRRFQPSTLSVRSSEVSDDRLPVMPGDKPVLARTNREPSTGEVLGTSTEADAALAEKITAILGQLVAEGTFNGPKGDKGDKGDPGTTINGTGIVQDGNGNSSAVIGGVPIVTYVPPVAQTGFNGTSLVGFGQLSAAAFTTQALTATGLTTLGAVTTGDLRVSSDALVSGSLTAATSTLSSLVVQGPVELAGSTTIANLTITDLNPGLTEGSVAFQDGSGLSQDNASFFYDSLTHSLGLGTSAPASTLFVQASGSTSPFTIASLSGTRLHRTVTIREENATAALEVMSRFAINPKWLIYLPPTMSPSETTQKDGYLEYPTEAFAYYRHEGAGSVICEQKHMGSRAVVIVCRDESATQRRFGVIGEGIGVCYTRTGRRFFNDSALESAFLARVQVAASAAGLWDELKSDWLCLDCELMPWSVKAQELLRQQYAPAGAAAKAALPQVVALLEASASVNPEASPLLHAYKDRLDLTEKYVEAYRRYCWPVSSIEDLRLAPFHLLASEGHVHVDRDHIWHMETLGRLCQSDPQFLLATPWRKIDLSNSANDAEATAWWESLTDSGGEGMVVKPLNFVQKGRRDLAQPAVKCRGREYLRIIYGPEYTRAEHLTRLRQRALGGKRSLALREFALGIESLERFVRHEPLRRVHECVFGVLALESEPVDPRL